MTTTPQPFNTVVFYDIENLLRGYNFSSRFAADLSLKEILADIVATGLLGRIAAQKAYANWSDPRLGILRNEINELGIAPVQVFGFSRDAKKNAADIQLAIDAVDLAHCRAAIETFVIVSGDGGFAALAKKLHEYGKTVIGCAYRNATNQTFQAVCDSFVWIEPPEEEEEERTTRNALSKFGGSGDSYSGSALQVEVVSKLGKKKPNGNREEMMQTVQRLLEIMATAPTFRRQMEHDGVPLTAYGQVLRDSVPDFDPTRLGFPKLTELLRYACTGTSWQVCKRSRDGILCVCQRSMIDQAEGLQPLDDIHEQDMHGDAYYRALLRQGTPNLRPPSPSEFAVVVEQTCAQNPEGMSLAEIVDSCVAALQGAVSAESVKQSILTMVAAEVFNRTPEELPLAEQKLALRVQFKDSRTVCEHARKLAWDKITKLLGNVNEDTLSLIL